MKGIFCQKIANQTWKKKYQDILHICIYWKKDSGPIVTRVLEMTNVYDNKAEFNKINRTTESKNFKMVSKRKHCIEEN